MSTCLGVYHESIKGRSVLMPVSQSMTMQVDNEERESAYTEWLRRGKRCGSHRSSNGQTPAELRAMPFVRSFKEADYQVKLSDLTDRLHGENSVPNELPLSLWCGSDSLSDE